MKKLSDDLLAGHGVGFHLADGRPLFSHLTFKIPRGHHGLIGPDEDILSRFQRIIAGDLVPNEGTVVHQDCKPLYFAALENIDGNRSVADELGCGPTICALRQIKAGAMDPALFEILAENWDAEENCQRALGAVNLLGLDLQTPLVALQADVRLLVRFASIQMQQPDLVVWDEPIERDFNPTLRTQLLRFFESFSGSFLVKSRDQELLNKTDYTWKLSPLGLRYYPGGFNSFLEVEAAEAAAAEELLERAQLELMRRKREADDAHERRRARRDWAQKFADSGLPKSHRGNMKRRSQETLAKANASTIHKVEEAEEQLRRAQKLHDEILDSSILSSQDDPPIAQ